MLVTIKIQVLFLMRSAWERYREPRENEPPLAYEVRPSGLENAGLGLYATRRFRAMEEIGIYSGTPMSFSETVGLDGTYFMSKPGSVYKGFRSEGYVIDGGHYSNDMRWINHKKRGANARISYSVSRDVMVIKTIRAVECGEEFFMDYGYDLKREVQERQLAMSRIEPRCNDKECIICIR